MFIGADQIFQAIPFFDSTGEGGGKIIGDTLVSVNAIM